MTAHLPRILSHLTTALAGIALVLSPTSAMAEKKGLRDTMDYMAGEFATALKLASASDPLTEKQRARLDNVLDQLAEQGGLLAAHATRDEFALMAANLRYLAQSTRWAYRRGDERAFQAQLDQMLGACAACHRRSAPGSGSGFARALVDSALLAEVGLERRIRILIATRQFEVAARDPDKNLALGGPTRFSCQ